MDEAGRGPVRVAVVGAGKFASMFLSRAPKLAGVHVVGVADLDPAGARSRLERVGWELERLDDLLASADAA